MDDDATDLIQVTSPLKRKRNRPASRQVQQLRDLSRSHRYFWRDEATKQFALEGTIVDYSSAYNVRNLTASELQAMALNEVAAQARYGYFYHLPSLQQWNQPAGANRLPPQRDKVGSPSNDYPTLLYMKYRWTEDDYNRYLQESHRGRFLLSSILMHPPRPDTPLYGIQYLGYADCPCYMTSRPSVVLIAVKPKLCYYLVGTPELARYVDNQDKSKQRLKIKGVQALWASPGSESTRKTQTIQDLMQQHRLNNTNQVYDKIISQCCPVTGLVAPSFTVARLLAEIVPRPDATAAASVGAQLGQGDFAWPSRTQRGAQSKGKPGKMLYSVQEGAKDDAEGDPDAYSR